MSQIRTLPCLCGLSLWLALKEGENNDTLASSRARLCWLLMVLAGGSRRPVDWGWAEMNRFNGNFGGMDPMLQALLELNWAVRDVALGRKWPQNWRIVSPDPEGERAAKLKAAFEKVAADVCPKLGLSIPTFTILRLKTQHGPECFIILDDVEDTP